MRFVVCIKEVPDTTDVKIDPETNTLIREGVPSIINPFDAFALELALKLKDSDPSIEIITLSMGPRQAEKSLRETIGMGADRAILISDRALAGSDTWATSYILSRAIEKIGDVDLIFTGKQAIDGDTAQVGPGIAKFLGIPQAIFVKAIRKIDGKKLILERLTENGYDILELSMPALISVIKLPKDPRLPSLKGMMRAKKAEIPVWGRNDLNLEDEKIGLSGSPTKVIKIFTPPKREGCKVFEGEPNELAERIFNEMKERGIS